MKSALALIVAMVLIGGAVYVRTNFLGSAPAEGTPTEGASTPTTGGQDDGQLRVVCDDLLGDACPDGSDRLDLSQMLDAFAQPVEYDALVAPSSVVELIEQSQQSRARFGETREVLAITPLVAAVITALDERIADACEPEVTWMCLSGLIQEEELTPVTVDSRQTTQGLMAIGALTGGFFQNPSYSSNSFLATGFLDWLDSVERQFSTNTDPAAQIIRVAAANNTAVGTEQAVLATVGRSNQGRPDVYWPTPLASLQVVAVAVNGGDQGQVDEVGADVAEALVANGWRGPDGQAVQGTPLPGDIQPPPVAPGEDGLPSGGTLFSLRDRLE